MKTDIYEKALEETTARHGDTLREEAAILRANRRYFENGAATPAKRDDCETAIVGAINRYFNVDVAELTAGRGRTGGWD